MYQSAYYVDKTTDTFSDVLLAHGLAQLLYRLGGSEVHIQDAGSVYAVILDAPITEGAEETAWFCDVPFIQTRGKSCPEDWYGPKFDYEGERVRRAAYFEARNQLPKEARRPGATADEFPALAALHDLQPRPDWEIVAQINQMGAITAYTQVLTAWLESRNCFSDLLRIILSLFANTPNDVDSATKQWRVLRKRCGLDGPDAVTPVQVLNPTMGKGLHRVKADGAQRLGNPPDSFWVLEFLKFWGMRVAGIPRIVQTTQAGGRGPRDRKTYVLRPLQVSLETLGKVYAVFNQTMRSSTAVKMDVLAALRFTIAFLEQWLEGQLADVAWGEAPDDYVSGLAAAFYKDMGNAVALLNLSEIALPDWMRVEDIPAGRHYLALLEEHHLIVRSLQEERAEEYRLLQLYRDFLSARDLEAFFEFATGYGSLIMSRIERGQWAPRFTTDHLEVLIMGHDKKLKPILENQGFQNIATAIRRSTVTPQYFKAKGQRGPYDIRYGLGTELLRQATYPQEFVASLSAFLHEYNQENAQVNERYKGDPPVRRPMVTTEDIAQVLGLIDEYDSKTIANLLVAFGYAREPRELATAEGVSVEEDETGKNDETAG